MTLRSLVLAGLLLATGVVGGVGDIVFAQALDTTPSKKTLDESSQDNCEAVSSVVQRCATVPGDGKPKDQITKSTEKAKAGMDRENRRGTADALKGRGPTTNTPVGDAEQLGGVTVTGKTENKLSVEEVLQRAIGPPVGVSNGNGTVSHFAPNGSRYDCIEKCVGPACCVEVRALPNPAREVNGIGR